MRSRHASVLVLVLALSSVSSAQWSSDPAVNFPVADAAGDQITPKVSAIPTGGAYVAWFDHRGSNYDVYLQRLDANGFEAWQHNGILVSAHSQQTFVIDWDLITDSSGNAVLTFTDIRAGGDLDVYAYRVDPSGQQLWGPDGVTLSSDGDADANPVVAEMSDGSFVFAWSRSVAGANARLVVQKLDQSGAPQFGAAGIEIFGGAGDDPGFVHVVPSLAGSFILTWIRDTTPFVAPRHLHAQRFDVTGAPVWPAPLAVYDAAGLPIAYKAETQSDGLGGAYLAWHVSVGAFFQGRVQHVDATGAEIWPHNGVEISTEVDRSEFNPSMAQLGGDLIVFYNKRNSAQSLWGIGAQRVSAAGQLLWGSSGIESVPYDATPEEAPRAVPAPGGAMGFVEQGNFTTVLLGFRVDGAGNATWSPSPIDVSSTSSPKDKLRAVAMADQSALVVWNDARVDSNDVYAQNVALDGTLGVPPALWLEYGCGFNPPGSLAVLSGTPSIGTTLVLGVDDPGASMPAGSQALLVVGALPHAAFPCGAPLGGLSMSTPGGPGELLVDLDYVLVPIIVGTAWSGSPVPFGLSIPNVPALVGGIVFFQGALHDAPFGRIGITSAIGARFGL